MSINGQVKLNKVPTPLSWQRGGFNYGHLSWNEYKNFIEKTGDTSERLRHFGDSFSVVYNPWSNYITWGYSHLTNVASTSPKTPSNTNIQPSRALCLRKKMNPPMRNSPETINNVKIMEWICLTTKVINSGIGQIFHGNRKLPAVCFGMNTSCIFSDFSP